MSPVPAGLPYPGRKDRAISPIIGQECDAVGDFPQEVGEFTRTDRLRTTGARFFCTRTVLARKLCRQATGPEAGFKPGEPGRR